MFKKVVLLVAAVLLIALPAAAFDFGGSVDASAGAAISDSTTFSPSAKATVWVKAPLGNITLSAEGYYKWSGSFIAGTDPSNTNVVDLSLLKISLPVADFLSLNIGRYSFSDVTSSVFATASDGVNAAMTFGKIKVGAYAGYTGLLNANTVTLAGGPASDAEGVYVLAPKFAVLLANVSLPNFLGGNTFALEATGALDLNAEEDGYEACNSFYGTLSAAGPVTTSIYYSASATGSFLTKDEDNLGIFGKGSIVCYLPVMSLSITASAAYGSENFQAVSYNPYAGGILNGGLSVTLKPIDSLLCLVSGGIDCNTVGEFSAEKANWTALAKWQVLSDLSAFLSLGQDIALTDGGTNKFTVSAGATVSF